MYNDTLIIEVWSADKLPEEDSQTSYSKDFLGRLITGSMRLKKTNVSNKPCNLEISPKDSPKNETLSDNKDANKSPKEDIEDIQIPVEEENRNNEQTKESEETSFVQNGVGIHDDLNQSTDKADSVSMTSEHSTDPCMTSTPKNLSASSQHIEATNGDDSSSSEKTLQKGKGFRSSFRLKSGLTKAFRRSSQNIHDDSLSSSSGKPADSISLQSGCSDASFQDYSETDTPDRSRKLKSSKLDREASSSTLSLASITSMTRRKLSMKLSSQKATQALRRIGSSRGKKRDSEDGTGANETEHQEALHSQNGTSSIIDSVDKASVNKQNLTYGALNNINTSIMKSSLKKSLTPRPMRHFKNMMGINSTENENVHDAHIVKPEEPNSPIDIQDYLSSIDKGHLQAELLASTKIFLKGIVGVWVKEEWYPMTLKKGFSSETTSTKDKSNRSNHQGKSQMKTNQGEKARVLCRMHVCLTMPQPESELHLSAYDTFSLTYRKLIAMQIQCIQDLASYKGSVGVVGETVLEQLYFFSRVSKQHKKLIEWLVLSEKKPSDSVLLYPLLKGVRTGLKGGVYNTSQKSSLAKSLSEWVRYVMLSEFEVLHKSFPACTQILDPTKLEHFLRCFKEIEDSPELQTLFEREMNIISFPSLTDQLKGALAKHAEIWIAALNKEPEHHTSDGAAEVAGANSDDTKWHNDLMRAASLTKAINDFVQISMQTYQPIFMVELSVDYLYWVMPKVLTAALHLINKTKAFTVDRIHRLPQVYIKTALQASCKICNNLSDVNLIGVKSKLPIHLIEQEYRIAFALTVLQWLALCKILSLEEMEHDIQQDEFITVDPDKGYSCSALSMSDLLNAIMNRLKSLQWPGGVQPGKNTFTRFALLIMSLVTDYKKKIVHAYNVRGGYTDRIPSQACVVVRNIEYVCQEARRHLNYLVSNAKKELKVQEELHPDEAADANELHLEHQSKKLQSLIDDAAEKLLQKCFPRLEELLIQAVSRESQDYIIQNIQAALQPIEDKLYFAEPLLYAMWVRIFQHTSCLKDKFNH
ncbi:hypothetical protein SK128_025630, partial [Halocaridina rubra]